MELITQKIIQSLYRPPRTSHKGENGKLTIIGGSELFHGASLWALTIASRIVDMVYYSSIPANNKIAQKLKSEIFDFISVPREEVNNYIKESEAILLGPGLTRSEQTRQLTKKLLFAFPQKKWILDAGSLQMMEKEWLKKLKQVVITPHQKEFKQLFNLKTRAAGKAFGDARQNSNLKTKSQNIKSLAGKYGTIIVLKGPTDIICSPKECAYNTTGNEGMTKGGTGDVLAGLIAALACKNDLFLAACAGVYINGLAGDRLYQKVGPFYNTSDLCDKVAMVLKEVLGY